MKWELDKISITTGQCFLCYTTLCFLVIFGMLRNELVYGHIFLDFNDENVVPSYLPCRLQRQMETDFSSDLRKEWAPLKLDPSFLWLPGKSQAYSEICPPIHYSMKLGKLFGQV